MQTTRIRIGGIWLLVKHDSEWVKPEPSEGYPGGWSIDVIGASVDACSVGDLAEYVEDVLEREREDGGR